MNEDVVFKIVQATGVLQSELILVHFWGDDVDKHIANNFCKAVVVLGATPVLLQQSRIINKDIFSFAQETCFNEKYFELFEKFDAVLDIFAYQPIVLGYEIKEEQYQLYQKYMREMFSRFVKMKRFTQIRVPTEENAKQTGLESDEYMKRMILAYNIDYSMLRRSCEMMIDNYKGKNILVLCTGDNYKLHFEVDNRVWYMDAGDGDFPCGEIYIAPIEEKTWGIVFFEELFIENIGKFENVLLQVKSGKLINSNHQNINLFLDGLMENEKTICELGIGMNPNIHSLCGITILDEKMKGTFHIAIGNNIMFGGKNNASNHIDFVGIGKIIGGNDDGKRSHGTI